MALNGTYQDVNLEVWKDMYLQEAQDRGSRLRQIVLSEMMEGNKAHFSKIGAVSSTEKTSRLQERSYAAQTYEDRFVQHELAEYSTAIDIDDLIRNVANPKSELMTAAIQEIGRRCDDVIMNAISGTAPVTAGGTTSNQALTLSVAVNDHTYDSGSGDVGLTVSKLKKAIGELSSNYGYDGTQRLVCVAPYKQILNLTQDDQFVSSDFRSKTPLEGPGVVANASGFMNIDFIAFERTGTDSNDDELAFLLTDDAVKLGIFKPLYTDLFKDYKIVGSPDAIAVGEGVGAVRMYEEKVCSIACNPIA